MSKTMTEMNKDEKRLMLFDMQEHPEKYTDEQVADLLADAEVKEFLRDMAMARMSVKKANPQKVDVDEAWKEFSKANVADKAIATKTKAVYRSKIKIAASIAGIIFLSGFTFAAVQNGWLRFLSSDKTTDDEATPEQVTTTIVPVKDSEERKDTLSMKPIVFDNTELGVILAEMSEFYRVKVVYLNAETKHIRLFFNWNKTNTLEQNLEILNAFDRIHIDYADGILKVK